MGEARTDRGHPGEDGEPASPDGASTPDGGGDGIAALSTRVRSALGRLRRWPERALHPVRRQAARRRLQEAPPPSRVLFVCHGNICRSPYAEGAFRRRVSDRVDADSAGFFGPDRAPPPEARQVAEERGVDLSGHRSKVVDRRTLARAGLVVVMEPGQARALERDHGVDDALVLGDLDPESPERRTVRDPVMQPAEVFREVYGRIDRCLDALIEAAGVPRARRTSAAAPGEDPGEDQGGDAAVDGRADDGPGHEPLRSRLGAVGTEQEIRPDPPTRTPGDRA